MTLAVLATSAHAEPRSTTGRSRLELALDHGYGFGTEGDFLEIGTDFRVHGPNGVGAALRVGVATTIVAIATVAEVGASFRFDLIERERWGLQLAAALGPTIAVGPFDGGRVTAIGGWSLVHLDLWVGVMFVGIGASGHALWSERHDQYEGRSEPILTITPTLRVGFDWGV
jgi:hypothetical protein